jgi:two-component system, OmpR family, response regulator
MEDETMRVLLIDGEEHLVAAIRRELQAEGIFVDTAADVAEGLFKAREGCYAVIILAARAPGKGGYEICQQLREAQVWTPLLVLMGQGGEAEETCALN